jgi:hypothetical protein
MMAGMSPEEARHFYEEDEDPKKVFALFDAARREGRVGQTEPPPRPSEPMPLGELLVGMARDLRRELRELRLRDRLALHLERVARAIRSHNKVS